MTHLNIDHGYTGYRCYMSTTRLCGVREGGDVPVQYPSILVKTSDKYVTYVTPVTNLKFLFELTVSGGTAKTPSN